MNRIAQSLLTNFVKDHLSGQEMAIEEQFEHFAAYLCIGPHTETAFSTFDVVVAANAQPAIDAIGVIVNGSIVNDVDDVDALIEVNGFLDVDFAFVQAKTSEAFNVASFGHMGDFVEMFFSNSCPATATDAVRAMFDVKEHIYDQANRFKRRNPRVHCYYVSTGELTEANADFSEKTALIKSRLLATKLFDSANAETIGVSMLQKLSQQMSNVLSRKIHFPKKLSLPDIPNVSQALVGVLPATEFLVLIRGESDATLSSIFYDNVRDWQGMNDVNTGIERCLLDTEARSRFVLMNNGVTVIAKKVQQTGESVVLENYQIVNGCQTSNVLWKNRGQLSDSVLVPIRIVETANDQVTRDIIRATNSQTEVSQSQLLAITDFQKQLEQHFASYEKQSLFYERRSNQYETGGFERARIVAPIGLVKAFAAMFLDEPHRTARDFASVTKKIGAEIFAEKHKHEPYFLAALSYYWVEQLIRREKINKDLRRVRYHLLLSARIFEDPRPLPDLKSNKIQKFAVTAIGKLRDEKGAVEFFSSAAGLLSKLIEGHSRDDLRTAAFTARVVEETRKYATRLLPT